MENDRFEWDDDKSASNACHHAGVDFDEASTVFDDPMRLEVADDDHSDGEERYTTVGQSMFGRLLRVTHTDREARTRIISARPLTRSQQKGFHDGSYP